MERRTTRYQKRRELKKVPKSCVDPGRFGVSFSLKQCRDLKINQADTLHFLLHDMGFRRFRLMSYWNEHEKNQGDYDFTALDAQIALIEKHGGVITMCLGVRQPRWPENHWPDWALELNETERFKALSAYIRTVVKRYVSYSSIISWQLENEALNRGFGINGNFNRARFRSEYQLVRKLDPKRMIIMSTSNTYGIPLRQPRPNLFGFTLYGVQYQNGTYSYSKIPPWWYPLRAHIIKIITARKSFIHELQAEPWGPKAIWEMSIEEQDKSMDLAQLQKNIQSAKKSNLYPVDLWGGEWWYWRYLKNDRQLSSRIIRLIKETDQ